jgi:hypothetical protein
MTQLSKTRLPLLHTTLIYSEIVRSENNTLETQHQISKMVAAPMFVLPDKSAAYVSSDFTLFEGKLVINDEFYVPGSDVTITYLTGPMPVVGIEVSPQRLDTLETTATSALTAANNADTKAQSVVDALPTKVDKEAPPFSVTGLTIQNRTLKWDRPSVGNGFKIVWVGSSTFAGTGASSADYSVVGLTNTELIFTFSKARLYTTQYYTSVNLGTSGYSTWDVLPTGYRTPTGKPTVKTAKNITYALSQNPNAIVCSLPSNDLSLSSDDQFISNLKTIEAAALSVGIPVLFLSTHPRNSYSANDKLRARRLAQKIVQVFPGRALDVYSLLTTDADTLKTEYDFGDGVHLNDAGHLLLHTQVMSLLTEYFSKHVSSFVDGYYVYRNSSLISFVDRKQDIFSHVAGASGDKYTVRAVRGSSLSPVGQEVTANFTAAAPVVNETISVSFGYPTGGLVTAGYNNLFHDPRIFPNVAIELQNASGQASGVTLTNIVNSTYGWGVNNGEGAAPLFGATTGNSSGVFPDSALSDYWFTDNTEYPNGGLLHISGLAANTTWRIEVIGSRSGSDGRTAQFIIGTDTRQYIAAGNTGTSVVFAGIAAVSGAIDLIVKAGPGFQYGYLNALKLTRLS